MRVWKLIKSRIAGKVPTLNEIDDDSIALNQRDGIAYIVKIDENGIRSVVTLGNNVQSDWLEEDQNHPSFINNKPNLNAIADRHITFHISNKLFEVINHNLGKNPSVSIVDANNDAAIADVEYIDTDTVKVSFTDFFTGKIIFN